MHGILWQAGFDNHLPATFLYRDVSIMELLNHYGALYLKACQGYHGRKVYKVTLEHGGIYRFYHHTVKAKETFTDQNAFQDKLNQLIGKREYIVQEEIAKMKMPGDNYFDIRVLVQKNINGVWGITNTVSRITNRFFENTSIFEKAEFTDRLLTRLRVPRRKRIIAELHEISLKAAFYLEQKLGHLGELSVDFILDPSGKLYIIEVNGKPQRKVYDFLACPEATGNVLRRPLEYAYHLHNVGRRFKCRKYGERTPATDNHFIYSRILPLNALITCYYYAASRRQRFFLRLRKIISVTSAARNSSGQVSRGRSPPR